MRASPAACDDGRADGEGDLAAACVAGEGGRIGVGVDDADAVGLDAERLGGHQHQAGVGAGDVDRADDDGQGAVVLQAADGAGRLEPAEQPADGYADALVRARPRFFQAG